MQKPILRLLTSLLFSLFIAHHISAQKFNITGTLVDDKTNPLVSASVVVLNQADSILVSFGISNNDGKYKIQGIKGGEYILQITYLGFEQYKAPFELTADKEFGEIALKPSSSKLDEVVIKGEHNPILIKKDTIVYNAAAFQTQPNEMVEDLLKKLPGVEVEDDGTVIAQGEEVEKVLVDGKEFFGDDPKMATKNLPAEVVDKVEIYDKKSDQAEFSGIDDGEREKTINLELKEDKKQGYFGQISGGIGTTERYTGRASINRFSKNTQLSFVGNFNNVNEQGFSFNEYQNFMGGAMSFRRGGGLPFNNGLSNGFVNTLGSGVNLNYTFKPKTKLNINYLLYDIENDIDQISARESFLEEGSYFTDEESSQLSGNMSHRVNLLFEHEIDSTQDLKIRSSLNLSNSDLSDLNFSKITSNNIVENTSDNDYASTGDNLNISGNLTYRKKFGKKKIRILTFDGNINSTEADNTNFLESTNEFLPNDPILAFTEKIVQDQLQTNDQLNYTLRTTFTEPLSKGKFIEFSYNRRNFSNELIKEVYDILNGEESVNLDLSDHFERDFVSDIFGATFTLNKDKLSLTMGGSYQHSNLYGDIISDGYVIDKNYNHFLPRLYLRKDFGVSRNISFRYSTSVNEPSLTQLSPIVDNTNPVQIYIGNPDLRPEYRNSFRINYVNYNQFNFTSFFAFINASYTRNNITNKQSVDESFRQITTPVNVADGYNVNAWISYATPVNLLKTRVSVNSNLGYTRSTLFINERENDSDRYNTSITFKVENRKKDVVDFSIGTRLSYNVTEYSESGNSNQNYFNQRYFTDLTVNIKKRVSFSSSFDYDIYDSGGFENNQKVPIWRASASAYVLESKRLELKVSAFDLLNENLGINQTSTLNYLETERITSLGRYVMFSAIYSLSGFGGNKGGGDMIIRRF